MRYHNLTSTSDLKPRDRLRVTWSRSLIGDVANAIAGGWRAENELRQAAGEITGRIPDTAVAWKHAGPESSPSSDSFTADITLVPALPTSGFQAAHLAAVLDAIAGARFTLTRMERLTEATALAGAPARQAANASAANAGGATGLLEGTRAQLERVIGFTGTTLQLVAIAAGLGAIVYLGGFKTSGAKRSGGAPPAGRPASSQLTLDGRGTLEAPKRHGNRGQGGKRGAGGKFVKRAS